MGVAGFYFSVSESCAMKIRYVFLPAFLLVLFSGSAPAEVKITDVSVKEKLATVQFMYRNESGNVLSIVKIECSFKGKGSRREKGIIYFNNHLYGGIKPGYSRAGTVEVYAPSGKPAGIICKDYPQALILK